MASAVYLSLDAVFYQLQRSKEENFISLVAQIKYQYWAVLAQVVTIETELLIEYF